MRRLLIAASLAVALVVLTACGGGDGTETASTQPSGGTTAGAQSTGASSTPALATRTVEAGAVTVKIDPTRLDAGGAEFDVSFDTHSVALDLDVAGSAALTVAGAPWAGATWSGDGPGGHHREGTLRFAPGGPAEGRAALSISGLPGPVTAAWTLGS